MHIQAGCHTHSYRQPRKKSVFVSGLVQSRLIGLPSDRVSRSLSDFKHTIKTNRSPQKPLSVLFFIQEFLFSFHITCLFFPLGVNAFKKIFLKHFTYREKCSLDFTLEEAISSALFSCSQCDTDLLGFKSKVLRHQTAQRIITWSSDIRFLETSLYQKKIQKSVCAYMQWMGCFVKSYSIADSKYAKG